MPKMKSIDVNQRSDEWLQWRSKGVTASDMPTILGLNPYKTVWQLWAEKTGRINAPDISNNPNVKRGLRLEDKARLLAEAKLVAQHRYGEILLPMCGECERWSILRASFDGLDSTFKPYEFKAPCDSVWKELDDIGVESKTYKMYEAQVHAQCIVSGSTSGRLMFYKEGDQDIDFPVTLSLEREEEILQAAKIFWRQVQTKTPPEPDPERDWYIPESGDHQFLWDANADAWRTQHHRIQTLKDELEVLKEEQKGIQKALIAQMGPFMQADVGGVKVSRYLKAGTIDFKAFLENKFPNEDLTDQLECYRKSSRSEARFSKSEDELVNPDVSDVVTSIKSAYF